MQAMRFYIDTHDRNKGTFPAQLSVEDFKGFYALYKKACYEENVVPIQIHLSYDEGRAFCLNMAHNVDAVKRVHEKVGLPFDSITEVTTAIPGNTFFQYQNA